MLTTINFAAKIVSQGKKTRYAHRRHLSTSMKRDSNMKLGHVYIYEAANVILPTGIYFYLVITVPDYH